MERTKAQKRANRRVNAENSTRNIVTGLNGVLLNETLTAEECQRLREARGLLEENLKNWRSTRADGNNSNSG